MCARRPYPEPRVRFSSNAWLWNLRMEPTTEKLVDRRGSSSARGKRMAGERRTPIAGYLEFPKMGPYCFDYVITIHNKEELLERVLEGVARCAGPGARVIPVLDGCSDGSESIARRFERANAVDTCIITA